jgi:gluconolactonase
LQLQGVYRIPPGGGEAQLLGDDFGQPNGLCFSADESLLYINDTENRHIRVFDVAAGGTIENGRVLVENIGTGDFELGDLVDGMKLDERGNVWVTGPGGVWVFDARASTSGRSRCLSRSATSTGVVRNGAGSSSQRRAR